ncbi:gastric triacylglycerol lipase-like [Rhipicephalus sanguineus]|uniref:gastric triacylglycerol lipase-like n=1 Tax=Rhipicephalus sanguineus TaxID=34632 RepID=UPI0020C58F61|nr:gastric triacylglycerol lipase-like [Rhipicephalus sanguineus]
MTADRCALSARFVQTSLWARFCVKALLWCGLCFGSVWCIFEPRQPDAFRTPADLIRSKGYRCQEFTVTTQDSYVLSMQRIPHGRTVAASIHAPRRPPVILVHGFLSSAVEWVINYPHQSLGFLLADAGYDVWLANLRGTPYARQHLQLTEQDTEYWNFGLDEMGLYDIPALVDYVLAWTGWSELFYVGFSQGNAAAWITLSEKPEYNAKAALVKLNRGRVLVREPSLRYASYTTCDTTTHMRYLCSTPGFHFLGVNHAQLNVIRRAKQFRKYSYGVWGNLERYGHPVAPTYDLSRVRVPVAMFSSLADYLAPPEDVAALRANLWHVLVYDYVVPDPNFSHLDFVLGFRVYEILYKPMLELLDVWSRDYLVV